MSDLGYSSFINKYKKIIIPIILGLLIVTLAVPICVYQTNYITGYSDTFSFLDSVISTFRINDNLEDIYHQFIQASSNSLTYAEFYASEIIYCIPTIISCIIVFIAIICWISFALVFYIKKSVVKSLLFVPTILLFIYSIVLDIILKGIPVAVFIWLIEAVLIGLYVFNFQHLSIRKISHKPTKAERITELEKRIEELESKSEAE